jgi:hypothetical protein
LKQKGNCLKQKVRSIYTPTNLLNQPTTIKRCAVSWLSKFRKLMPDRGAIDNTIIDSTLLTVELKLPLQHHLLIIMLSPDDVGF